MFLLFNFLGTVLAWFGGIFVSFSGFFISLFSARIAVEVLKFAAWKVFLLSLMLTVYPAVMMFISLKMLKMGFELVQSFFASSSVGGIPTFELTGLASWLFTNLRLTEAFVLIFSAISFRIALSLIPAVGGQWMGYSK